MTGLYSAPRPVVSPQWHDSTQVFSACFECRPIGGAPKADGVETIDVRYFAPGELPENMSARWRMYISDALSGRKEAVVR